MPVRYVCELCHTEWDSPSAYWDHADTHDPTEWERFREHLLAQYDNPWLPPNAAGVEVRSQNCSVVGTDL